MDLKDSYWSLAGVALVKAFTVFTYSFTATQDKQLPILGISCTDNISTQNHTKKISTLKLLSL
jgi:hypothetical protein